MKRAYDFLKACGTFYLATVDGDQPRVRPFGAVALFEDKLYITTGNVKPVFAQLMANPKIEISGMLGGDWIRLTAVAVRDERREAKTAMLEENPVLRGMYSEDDGVLEVLYLTDATVSICSFTKPPVQFTF